MLSCARWLLALSLGLCLPVTLPAQSPAPPQVTKETPLSGPASKQMYEDVEIFRRLLPRSVQRSQTASCTSCHTPVFDFRPTNATGPSAAFTPDGKNLSEWIDGIVRLGDANMGLQPARANVLAGTMPTVVPVGSAEGCYLKGQGVVFTLTLPLLPPHPAQPGTPVARKVSEWEQTRMQLRGEQPKKDAAPPPQPDLAEVLLRLLADNGHHFSQLKPHETLTIAVTFRGKGEPQPKVLSHDSLWMVPKGNGYYNNDPTGYLSVQPSPYAGDVALKVKDLELLADLQLKQSKVDEAVQLYLQAVQLKPGRQQLTGLYRKLAKAYLVTEEQAQKSEDRARALENASHYLKKLQERGQSVGGGGGSGGKAPPPAPKGTPLPSRLTVSAPKQLLDAVAAGKITFAEFRQAATVDWLHFPVGEVKAAPLAK